MTRESHNTQLFALRNPPPERIEVHTRRYRLVRVFKHDFWAATCLYEAHEGPRRSPKHRSAPVVDRIVVKFGRDQPFCGLPLSPYARMLADHEETIYRALEGVEGVPRWIGRIGKTAFAIEYVDARPLDHLDRAPVGLFDRLRTLIEAIHARGVAYCDANKRSNILVTDDGRPFLIDYQIAIRRCEDWRFPFRQIAGALVSYFAAKDLYHLYKHKRRLAPDQLTPREDAISRRHSGIHWLHRKLTKPYRALRRRFLREQYAKGALRSPTADLEAHRQPEKDIWRKR